MIKEALSQVSDINSTEGTESYTAMEIFTEVKEDRIRLFGFISRLEKQVFVLLLKVKGIGPSIAMDLISRITPLVLLKAISDNDVSILTSIKGVGKKSAERLVLELRDKVGDYILDLSKCGDQSSPRDDSNIADSNFADALAALVRLGFSSQSSKRAIEQVKSGADAHKLGSSELVREALKYFSN